MTVQFLSLIVGILLAAGCLASPQPVTTGGVTLAPRSIFGNDKPKPVHHPRPKRPAPRPVPEVKLPTKLFGRGRVYVACASADRIMWMDMVISCHQNCRDTGKLDPKTRLPVWQASRRIQSSYNEISVNFYFLLVPPTTRSGSAIFDYSHADFEYVVEPGVTHASRPVTIRIKANHV